MKDITAKALRNLLRKYNVVMVGSEGIEEAYEKFFKDAGVKMEAPTDRQKELLDHLNRCEVFGPPHRNYSAIGNNKGITCPFKPLTCQEGYCVDCEIGQNAVPEAIRATVETTPGQTGSMTKQEEIREGMRTIPTNIMEGWGTTTAIHLSDKLIELILRYLHSRDLAIKVESELPKPKDPRYLMWTKEEIEKAGYKATVPLIEEV